MGGRAERALGEVLGAAGRYWPVSAAVVSAIGSLGLPEAFDTTNRWFLFVSGFVVFAVAFLMGKKSGRGESAKAAREEAQRDFDARARDLEHSYELRLAERDRAHDREVQDLRNRPSREQFDELAERVRYLESSSYRMTETIRDLPQTQKAALWYAYDVKGDAFSSRDCGLSEELDALVRHGILDRVKARNFDVPHYVISPGANGVVSGDAQLLEELETARDDTVARRERKRRDSLFRNFTRLTPEEKLVIIDLYHLKGHSGRIPNRTKRDLDNGCVGLRSFISADEIDPGSVNVHLEEGVAEMLEEHRDYVEQIEDARKRRRREEEAAKIQVDPSRLLRSLDLSGMAALRRLVGGDLRLDHYGEGELDALYEYGLVVEHDLADGGCKLELDPVVASYFSSRAGGDELDMAMADLERAESEVAG